jgi:hypothetical protein
MDPRSVRRLHAPYEAGDQLALYGPPAWAVATEGGTRVVVMLSGYRAGSPASTRFS